MKKKYSNGLKTLLVMHKYTISVIKALEHSLIKCVFFAPSFIKGTTQDDCIKYKNCVFLCKK